MKHVSCQTITYGDPQHDCFRRILADVKAAGYAGVEIGFRRLRHVEPTAMRTLLSDSGLELSGSHIGGNLDDTSQAAAERSVLDTVLDYLDELGVTTLMYSGLRYRNDDQFSSDLEMLNRSAETAASRGIQLLYHNHNWEFHHDRRVMNAILRNSSLGLCPDVGWIEKAGFEALGFLEEVKQRVKMVHFKDFASRDENRMDTVEFGRGVVPLSEIASWIQPQLDDLWIVAEQDSTELEPTQAVKANSQYLREHLS